MKTTRRKFFRKPREESAERQVDIGPLEPRDEDGGEHSAGAVYSSTLPSRAFERGDLDQDH